MNEQSFHSLYGDLPYGSLPQDLRLLLPEDKGDEDRARKLVKLGYPAVEPVLPHLMIWMQDFNWPVAKIISPFLASIGTPLIPEIRRVLHGDDDIWKYWVLSQVVSFFTRSEVTDLVPDLELLSQQESEEDVDTMAAEILAVFAAKDR